MTNKKKPYEKLVYIFFLILYIGVHGIAVNTIFYMYFSDDPSSRAHPLLYGLMDFGNMKFHYGSFFAHPGTYLPRCLFVTFIYAFMVALFFIYQQRYRHDAEGIEQGSAHWTSDMKAYNREHNEPFGDGTFDDTPGLITENLNNKNTPPVPGSPNMIMSENVRLSTADMKTHLNNNVFVVGGAGTGKSRFFVKPNILQMNASYVVTDPSGELLKSMHNTLVDHGYTIKVLNLVDMSSSCRYNPFRYISSDTDVGILVDTFLANTTAPDAKGGDPFWEKSEKALLSALIFYLRDVAEPIYQTFSTVLWMVQLAQIDENSTKTQDSTLDKLMSGKMKISHEIVNKKMVLKAVPVKDGELHTASGLTYQKRIETSLCDTNYKTFKLGGAKTLKSILITAAVRLNPFSMPSIQALTNYDETELETVGDRLTCFFAIIPQTNTTFNFLVSMMFAQMFEVLYRKGGQIANSRLPYHVRFLLDEFANIGKIPEFPQKISTCRKYNISATIILQSIAQIKTMYKDDYETIIANCDTSICLGTNEQTTADYFSKKLGKTTIRVRNSSNSVGKSGSSKSYNQTGRELMMPDEIMTMDYRTCIVMMNHCNPFLDNKYDVEKHPLYPYTADYSEDNLYSLADDPAFHISGTEVSSDAILAAMMMNGANHNKEDDNTMMPKNIMSFTREDDPKQAYSVFSDATEEDSRNILSIIYSDICYHLQTAKDEGYKIPVYDCGSRADIITLQSAARWFLSDRAEEVQELVLLCDTIDGSAQKDGVIATSKAIGKEESTARALVSKTPAPGLEITDGTAYSDCNLYGISGLPTEAVSDLKIACRKG